MFLTPQLCHPSTCSPASEPNAKTIAGALVLLHEGIVDLRLQEANGSHRGGGPRVRPAWKFPCPLAHSHARGSRNSRKRPSRMPQNATKCHKMPPSSQKCRPTRWLQSARPSEPRPSLSSQSFSLRSQCSVSRDLSEIDAPLSRSDAGRHGICSRAARKPTAPP